MGQEDRRRNNNDEENDSMQNPTMLTNPLHAAVEGKNGLEPVRAIAFGHVPGHSPAFLVIGTNLKPRYVSFDDLQVIDTSCAPLSSEALQQISKIAAEASEQRTTIGGRTR